MPLMTIAELTYDSQAECRSTRAVISEILRLSLKATNRDKTATIIRTLRNKKI